MEMSREYRAKQTFDKNLDHIKHFTRISQSESTGIGKFACDQVGELWFLASSRNQLAKRDISKGKLEWTATQISSTKLIERLNSDHIDRRFREIQVSSYYSIVIYLSILEWTLKPLYLFSSNQPWSLLNVLSYNNHNEQILHCVTFNNIMSALDGTSFRTCKKLYNINHIRFDLPAI